MTTTGSETFALDVHGFRHLPGAGDDIWTGLTGGEKAAIAAALGVAVINDASASSTSVYSSSKTSAAIAVAIAALVNSSPAALDTLKELADALGDDANFAATMTTALAGKMPALTPTAVKTGNYTASASDAVPCDTSSAAFSVTLPTAPADKTRILVKKIDPSLNAVTVARGGSDVFNKTGGSTTLTLSWQFTSVTLQYIAATGVWLVVASDIGNDLRLAKPVNFDAPSGSYVMPCNHISGGTVALIAGSSGIASWHPTDLVPGKSYDALTCHVSGTAQSGGTTVTTLFLYADKNGAPDVAAGPVASQTVTLTATGNRIGVLGSAYTPTTVVRHWAGLLYVETVAPTTRATLANMSSGLSIAHDTTVLGGVPYRGWAATGLATPPAGATALAGSTTPYIVGVRAA